MITFEIVVRELNHYKEARIELPNNRYVEELTEVFGEDWIDHDYEIVDVEDDYNIFHSYRLYGYQGLKELNDIAERVEEICTDKHHLTTLQAAGEAYTDIKEVLELMEANEIVLYEDHTMTDMAEWFVDEGWMGDVDEKIRPYIDYERLGRDIMLDGSYTETRWGVLETRV